MDVRLADDDRPVFVDLDETLIRTDLLWESLFLFARQKPLELWRVPLWLAAGRARLKAELAAGIEFDPAALPYRDAVVAEIEASRAAGRRVVLATGANQRLAGAVADHLGCFDAVIASDATTNLTPDAKLARIEAECGERGFSYFGHRREDLALLDKADDAVVVAPGRRVRQWQAKTGSHAVEDDTSRLRALAKVMRPHQWAKNVLVFVPMVLSHEYFDARMLLEGLLAFLAFSFAASSVYIVNDLLDLSADRRHKTKRRRPFAAGTVPIPQGLMLAAGLVASSVLLASMLAVEFRWMLAAYFVATTAYSFSLKRMLLVDVLTLAGLYTARIIAGAFAMNVNVSFWLLAFSVFFFLSLALVKRFTELLEAGPGAQRNQTGRGYVAADLETIGQAGMSSAFASVLVLALYIDSAEVRQLYAEPFVIWLLCPLVLYIIVRIWVLARRGAMHEDPVVFIMRDWRSQLMIALGAALFLLAANGF